MVSRKVQSVLLVVYAVIFVLCMIGWGVLAGLSAEGRLSTMVHRYVMLALVTITCCTVAATLQLATMRALRALAQTEPSDDGYAAGYTEGYAAALAARPDAASPGSSSVSRLVPR